MEQAIIYYQKVLEQCPGTERARVAQTYVKETGQTDQQSDGQQGQADQQSDEQQGQADQQPDGQQGLPGQPDGQPY